MYTKAISSEEPGCIIFLLDRSDSMQARWGKFDGSLADGATDTLNRLLFDLCVRCVRRDGQVAHYFDIGVFGYGLRPYADGEGVESGFGGALMGRELVSVTELEHNPLTLLYENGNRPGALGRPVWLSSAHGGRTPMCQAISAAGATARRWIERHPNSYPPIVINITDGMVTDDPYDDASLVEWADRLTGLYTTDGHTLLLNIYLTPDPEAPQSLFPASDAGLTEPGPTLFRISSPLPPSMVHQAEVQHIPVGPGSRGLAMNADLAALVKFLEIGTRQNVVDR